MIQRVALAIGSTLLTLLLVEVGLRALDITPPRWSHPTRVESDDKRHLVDLYPDDPHGYFEVDAREEGTAQALRARGLGEALQRAQETPFGLISRFSAELCRGADIPPKRATRIIALGDSFTEGQGVREDDAWPARLAALRDDEVINCGRRGHDFPMLREMFDRRLALEPDVVVYAMTLNDARRSDSFEAEQDFLNDWIMDRRRMLGDEPEEHPFFRSWIWAFVEDRREAVRVGEATTRWYREMYGEPNAEGWRTTVDDIEAMHRAMEARGGSLFVVIWPLFVSLEAEYPFAEVHETIREALRARGIRAADSLDAFLGRSTEDLWVHASDHHPNAEAHAIFARVVHDALEASP